MPLVEGALEPKVIYPHLNGMIQSRDSNFILGSVGNGRARLTINGQDVRVWPNGAFLGYVANPAPTATPAFELVASLGADTVRATHPVRVPGMPVVVDTTKPLPPPPPPNVVTDTTPTWVILGDSVGTFPDTDRVIIGRPGPNSVYKWFFLPGTRVQVTARYPGFARIRLDSALQVWVDALDAKTVAMDTIPPRRIVANSRVRASGGGDWTDFILPMGERPAFFVEERERSIELTLYDTRSNSDVINYPTSDSLIRHIEWTQERTDRARFTVHLSQRPFGYLVWYESGSLILRVRRRPPPSSRLPLQGLTIVVDPGHPPAGANGPTGFYEGDAVLPVGMLLERLLTERGANVVMTRTTRETVDLALRSIIARRANGHAFVSLHYNAYGDGINPLTQRNGAEVYFYRPHSEPLARDVQRRMLDYLPLVDQGVYYRSLSVVRNTWMPSVLVEGGFIIIPEQEAAMRTAEWQERYARAVADGLEQYFRALRTP
jgi:N-acetylmuramoyl-L-alanine amidase